MWTDRMRGATHPDCSDEDAPAMELAASHLLVVEEEATTGSKSDKKISHWLAGSWQWLRDGKRRNFLLTFDFGAAEETAPFPAPAAESNNTLFVGHIKQV